MRKHWDEQLSRERVALAILLAETLVFFHSLLTAGWTIPWDFQGYHFPLFSFIAHSLGEGRMPWWDPFTNGGNPFYANPQTQLFYPPAWPFYMAAHWVPEPRWAELYKWLPVLHVWLGGYFGWRLGRVSGLSGGASLAAGTVFAFGAFFTSQLQHVGAVCAAAWLPLAWEGALRRRAGLTAFAFGMSLLAGFPAMSIVVWGSTLLIGHGLTWLRGAFGGLILSLPMVWPAWQLMPISLAADRTRLHDAGGMPWQALITLGWPTWIPKLNLEGRDWPHNPTFLYLFCGWSVLLLALRAREWRWWLLCLFSGLLMFGQHTPVGLMVYSLLPGPVRGATYLEFWLGPFVLALALLAARGAGRHGGLLAVVVFGELLAMNSGRIFHQIPVKDAGLVNSVTFEGSTETMETVRRLAGSEWRTDVLDDSLNWASQATITRVASAGGSEPLALQRYIQIRSLFTTAAPGATRHRLVTDPASPVLDLLGIRYLLHWAPDGARPADPPGLRLVATAPGHFIYENPDALPRWHVPPKWRRFESVEQLRTVQPGAEVLLAGGEGSGSKGSVSGDETGMTVKCEARCLLASSVVDYPGWRVAVDGRLATLEQVNGGFLGVFLEAGVHRVEARFAPRELP